MTDEQWRQFFKMASSVLGAGGWHSFDSTSWCAFTTFRSLELGCAYYTHGVPASDELGDTSIKDGGTWGEPIAYKDLAHLIVPRRFFWETSTSMEYKSGMRTQDIDRLSEVLHEARIPHRLTDLVLEIKLY